MKAYIRHLVAMFATFFGSQAAMTPDTAAQDQAGQDREAQEWAAAKSTGTLKALEDYLARNPAGTYSREAFREIIRLSTADVTDIPSSDDIGGADPELIDSAFSPLSTLY